MRISDMKSTPLPSVHGIFVSSEIGSVRTFPALKEIVLSLASPTRVVYDFHRSLTSVSTAVAISSTVLGSGAEPGQLTETISMMRSSTATAGVSPRPTKPTRRAINMDKRLCTGLTLYAEIIKCSMSYFHYAQ